MKFRAILFTILVASGTAGAGYLYFEKRHADALQQQRMEAAKPEATPAITVSKVVTEDFVETAAVSGSLIPREEILVSPEVEGFRVRELFADEGDTVKKGEVLAKLVSEQIAAQLAQNDASQARAVAAIAQAQSQVTQAEAQAKEAQAQLDRAEPLKKSGWLSGSTYDQRESAARTTAAQVVAAKDGLKAAEAEKAQVEAQHREIAWRMSKTEVTAPQDGIVSRRMARIGGLASSIGEPMFRIIQNGEIELDAEVVETELVNVREGQKAFIEVPGTGHFEGKVRLVSPEVDKATRLGRVKLFLGAQPGLRVGSYAHGRIETAKSRGLAVPASAVNFEQGSASVQVIDNSRVARRVVTTGLRAGGLVEIKDGLKEGDVVVTRSGTFLRDGDEVRSILPEATVSEAR
jgi:RND family efflux transporter MFP subunit